jgi:hypothetical protein
VAKADLTKEIKHYLTKCSTVNFKIGDAAINNKIKDFADIEVMYPENQFEFKKTLRTTYIILQVLELMASLKAPKSEDEK